MIVLIDNYDSFSFNLVQGLASLGGEIEVYRNDQVTVEEVVGMGPAGLVISPGPCTPSKAGISVALIRALTGKVPILGVCLGHQCVGEAFGGTVSNAKRIMHGKVSQVRHTGGALYETIRSPFPAGRYHSLAVLEGDLPQDLEIEARSEDGQIMGLRHKRDRTYGVQFHPESVLTPSGKRLMRNFLNIVDADGSEAERKETKA